MPDTGTKGFRSMVFDVASVMETRVLVTDIQRIGAHIGTPEDVSK
jgi:hypothetical protein